MSKVGNYLQEHLIGEVVDSADALEFFSTDMSILQVRPGLVVYPRNENDVRKAARFCWQLAERGRIIPITARGAGTDLAGAALGTGIILAFPAHLNHVLDIDAKSGQIVVEPGANFAKVQQALEHVGRFIPPEPASAEYSTIGGAIANNASGERGFKYGSMINFVKSVRLVLANGEVIDTGRISKRELNRKLGLATFEGEIYRSLDTLIEENKELIDKLKLPLAKNTAGYNLAEVKRKDGSFDLTPLVVGSQGTLGIISAATIESEIYASDTAVLAGFFSDVNAAIEAANEVQRSSDLPASLEFVNGNLLKAVAKINPNLLKGELAQDNPNQPLPAAVLIAEFDDPSERNRKKATKKVKKIFDKYASATKLALEPDEKEALARIRRSQAVYSASGEANARPLPLIDDAIVPAEQLGALMDGLNKLAKSGRQELAVWGHIGDANLRIQPILDLAGIGDRQAAFKLMDEYYKLVISLGGSTSAELGDGRLRAPWLPQVYGEEAYQLLAKLKKIFDPYGTLNPGVKIGVTLDQIKPLIRPRYSLDHLYNHTPRS